eukprot:scaffold1143_cov177-Amphora_coffeaeformis.AAC.25
MDNKRILNLTRWWSLQAYGPINIGRLYEDVFNSMARLVCPLIWPVEPGDVWFGLFGNVECPNGMRPGFSSKRG